jgi:hypothetical protein
MARRGKNCRRRAQDENGSERKLDLGSHGLSLLFTWRLRRNRCRFLVCTSSAPRLFTAANIRHLGPAAHTRHSQKLAWNHGFRERFVIVLAAQGRLGRPVDEYPLMN